MFRSFRPLVLVGAVALLAGGVTLLAADNSADQAFYQQHIQEMVKVKAERINTPVLAKVLKGTFDNLTVTIAGSETTFIAAREGDKVVQLDLPNTTAPMPEFPALFKPEFTLKTDADSHTLQDVLDVLFPITGDDAKAKDIRHDGTTWTFVRGKFFDHFDGLIVKTDSSGKVTSVSRSLDIQ